MAPRGEVGMVVASIGLGMGVMSKSVYGIVVSMSVATTLVAPPLLRWAYRDLIGKRAAEEMGRLG
jgi:Kef-type K+ transport system membrane component KefB